MSHHSDTERFSATIQHLSHLRRYRAQQPPISHVELDAPLAHLRLWQSDRLARTYADLLDSPRYGPACRFFLSKIYAPRDFSQRDQDIEYLYTIMSSFLPVALLKLVREAIEMNNLTNELDRDLACILFEELGVDGVGQLITPLRVAEAYRIADNYAERAHQIELIGEVGKMVDRSTHIPLISATLHLARHPAKHAGWGELQDFLEQGFNAFKHMGRADDFLRIIQQREMGILDRIYANHPDPFLTS